MARELADRLFELLEQQGLWEESGEPRETPHGASKRVRRSPDALEKLMARILADLRTRAEPVSIGQIASALGLASRQIAHPMGLLVEQGEVQQSGERRGTRYRLPGRKRRSKRRR
jgi:hypothetical protein